MRAGRHDLVFTMLAAAPEITGALRYTSIGYANTTIRASAREGHGRCVLWEQARSEVHLREAQRELRALATRDVLDGLGGCKFVQLCTERVKTLDGSRYACGSKRKRALKASKVNHTRNSSISSPRTQLSIPRL